MNATKSLKIIVVDKRYDTYIDGRPFNNLVDCNNICDVIHVVDVPEAQGYAAKGSRDSSAENRHDRGDYRPRTR